MVVMGNVAVVRPVSTRMLWSASKQPSVSPEKSSELVASLPELATLLSECSMSWPEGGAGSLEGVTMWSLAPGFGGKAGSEEWPWLDGVWDL